MIVGKPFNISLAAADSVDSVGSVCKAKKVIRTIHQPVVHLLAFCFDSLAATFFSFSPQEKQTPILRESSDLPVDVMALERWLVDGHKRANCRNGNFGGEMYMMRCRFSLFLQSFNRQLR